MKKYLYGILILCTILCTVQPSFASTVSGKSMMEDEDYAAKISASDYAEYLAPEYITIEEYVRKYGANNIKRGLNKAEIENKVNVLKTASPEEKSLLKRGVAACSTKSNDVYLSMMEGEFLGMEIAGISDLPPDDTRLSFKLNKKGTTDEKAQNAILSLPTKSYPNYNVYYKSCVPDENDDLINVAYEPGAGSYMYKYSLAFENHCLVESEVVFNNTKLYCGNQSNNMYTYIAAKSQYRTLDFGLMANPKASERNAGMYACYNNGITEQFFVEAWPKVGLVGTSTSPMTIQNKTIKLRLGVGTASQDYRTELYMEMDGQCIFYLKLHEDKIDQIYAGDPRNYQLTFMTAISCVATSGNTNLSSGSYFKNVRMQNSRLYDLNGNDYPFTTMGDHTYYTFICKPTAIDFDYGNNWETVDIVYDN